MQFLCPVTEEFIFRLSPVMVGLLIVDIKILNGWLKQENWIRSQCNVLCLGDYKFYHFRIGAWFRN